jgi:carbonic anhydrase
MPGRANTHRLVEGIHQFQRNIFRPHKELFEHLAKGQRPDTLFITCSDSRINPNLFTQTDPGELFIMRNAGNIVPPYGATNGGEGATLEYAVSALNVSNIIVCGHSHCGAMTALLDPTPVVNMPAVAAWLAHAETTRRIVTDVYKDRPPEARLYLAVQENVLCQLENLRTHPAVAVGLARGQLHLHAWVFQIDTGEVTAYDPEKGQYVPISRAPRPSSERVKRLEPREI